jgi:FO synthase
MLRRRALGGGAVAVIEQSMHAPVSRHEAERLAAEALSTGRLERAAALRLVRRIREARVRETLLEAAFASKLRGKGDSVSVSRNVFIPLTNLCRDRCAYCSFAVTPAAATAKTYTLLEVLTVVEQARRAGCSEALFCLGDKPELAYKTHRAWLARRGLRSTAEHLTHACRASFEAGLLPHTNAGVLSAEEMAALRPFNASLGLMLETTSTRLRGKGMAHYHAPDKDPGVRLRMHREAGELQIAFTSGILLGIGESDEERVDTLLAIRELADRYGHIQEVIVQPFHPKSNTPMRDAPPVSVETLAAWVAMARLLLGPEMNLQAPPNLAPEALELLLRAGLNDWGGISPVTLDFINPEAPWPALEELARRTRAAGQRLKLRLPAYPEHLLQRPELFDPRVRAAALAQADAQGYARVCGVRSGEVAA